MKWNNIQNYYLIEIKNYRNQNTIKINAPTKTKNRTERFASHYKEEDEEASTI